MVNEIFYCKTLLILVYSVLGSKYDTHFFLRCLSKHPDIFKKPSVIGKNTHTHFNVCFVYMLSFIYR